MNKTARNYKLSDMGLLQRCDLAVHNLNRDAEQFNNYGLSAEEAGKFVQQINELKDFPDDLEFDMQRQEISMQKKQLKELIEAGIRNIKVRVKLSMGANHYVLKRLQQFNLSRLNDEEMLSVAGKAIRIAEKNIGALKLKGYNESELTQLKGACSDYDDVLDEYTKAVQLREKQSEVRVQKGNELYARLIEICEIGRVIWQNESHANYNDYVIYDTPSGNKAESEETPQEQTEEETP